MIKDMDAKAIVNDIVYNFVRSKKEIDKLSLQQETRLHELRLDSLDIAEIIMRIENLANVRIPESKSHNIFCLSDLYRLVEEAVK